MPNESNDEFNYGVDGEPTGVVLTYAGRINEYIAFTEDLMSEDDFPIEGVPDKSILWVADADMVMMYSAAHKSWMPIGDSMGGFPGGGDSGGEK